VMPWCCVWFWSYAKIW